MSLTTPWQETPSGDFRRYLCHRNCTFVAHLYRFEHDEKGTFYRLVFTALLVQQDIFVIEAGPALFEKANEIIGDALQGLRNEVLT